MKSDVLTLIPGQARTLPDRSRRQPRRQQRPETLDSLSLAIRDALRDRCLEVSKVRPFFWTLVETYTDRFRSYPFNTFKALYSDLELRDFPAEEMDRIITRLEQAYEEKHGKRSKPVLENSSEAESLDDEIQNLRDSLCYASLVPEFIDDAQGSQGDIASESSAFNQPQIVPKDPPDWS